MNRFYVAVLAALAFAGNVAALDFQREINGVLSRLQSMAGNNYASNEMQVVYRDLEDIERRATDGQAWDALVEARLVHAMALSDLQRNHQGAVGLLQQTRRELKGRDVPGLRKVYVRLAESYGRLGDEGAVNRTIEEFRASPYFDPQNYPFAGGESPAVPLAVTRPGASGSGSISETAMRVAQQQSRAGAGTAFPEYELADVQGAKISRQTFAGKVVLYDFWQKEWPAWKRDLHGLRDAYLRHKPQGFEIVGVSLDPQKDAAAAFAKAERMDWTQVADGSALARQLGIYGECSNVLVDRNGTIVGRNLRGGDLIEAIRIAVGR